MERDILFRGKRADNAEWIEGYYMYHINRTICPAGDSIKPDDVEHIILFDGFSDWNMPRGINYNHVLPETVCRYTGLTDKNGRKIFEGDIVSAWNEGSHATGRVKQRIDGLWLLYPAWQNKIMWGLCPNNKGETTVEIIGNIFDNPELLN